MSQENLESVSSNSLNDSSEDGPWQNPRLSKDVVPEKYKLFIYPHIKSGLFEGQVLIDLKVLNETNYILLHQTNLTIVSTKLSTKSDDSKEISIKRTWAFPKNHYWVIELNEELQPGSYELLLPFRGKLSSNTLGLYKSTYTNAANEECTCILSYFEATYARSAFPCFDEPSFRAVFYIKIAVEVDSGYVAISNGCRDKETFDYPAPGVKTVHFKPTPPVPPYLIALTIGDFAYTEPVSSNGNVSVAVYSRPEIVQHMKRAQDMAVTVLDFFSSYFDIPYTLPKLDLIALPDSNISGMENWGMITFREDCLLLNDDSTCDDLNRVTALITHEISHMWFGNLGSLEQLHGMLSYLNKHHKTVKFTLEIDTGGILNYLDIKVIREGDKHSFDIQRGPVTISWWDNLWLKEGFATFMSTIAGAEMFPEWYNDWAQIRYSLNVLHMDAPFGSHPLVQTVNTPAEIRSVFDAISYNKGCCVIRMLRNLDPEGFQEGIRSYLKRYKLSSTVSHNLWDEIQGKVDFDVTSFMDTWTHQMGFPVLEVRSCAGSRVTVSQSRFLQNKHSTFDPDSSPYKYKWNIPIKYITSKNLKTPHLIWLNKDQESVALESDNSPGWIKVNWHQVGFYRVNYSAENWDIFSLQLIRNPYILDVEDRANLINDAFSLACAGYFHYNIPLNLLRYLKFGKENHFFTWSVTFPYLQYIGERLFRTEGYSIFLKFIHVLLKNNLTEEIWNFDDAVPILQKKLQLELIRMACWFEEAVTLEKVRLMFTEWRTNKVLPHPELRAIVYTYGLASDVPEEVWSEVVSHTLNDVTDVVESLNLWRALGRVKNQTYLKSLIELAKDEKNLKSQNFFIVINSIAMYPLGLGVVWDFFRNEWEYLVNRFTLEDPCFNDSLHFVCSKFGTEERLKEVQEFSSILSSECFTVLGILETCQKFILGNMQWLKLFGCRLLEWVNEYLLEEEILLKLQRENEESSKEILSETPKELIESVEDLIEEISVEEDFQDVNEWEYLVNRFTLEDPGFNDSLHFVCSKFGTEERLKETTDFFAKYPEAGAGVRLREMALEKIKDNIAWSKTNLKDIFDWLKTSDSDDFFDKNLESFIII